jgi:hypothetical protein
MTPEPMPDICARVFEVLVDGTGDAELRPREDGDGTTPEIAAHLGSCMRCFRVMTELRDASRLATAVRAAAPVLPEDDGFWEALARRTLDATAASMDGRVEAVSTAMPAPAPIPALDGRRRRRLGAAAVAAVSALAAAVLLVPSVRAPRPHLAPRATAGQASSAIPAGDEPWAAADVSELDGAALRRLLDRLGARAPQPLAHSSTDVADAPDVDDDTRVNDELAELDGPALLRVARSFERSRL